MKGWTYQRMAKERMFEMELINIRYTHDDKSFV